MAESYKSQMSDKGKREPPAMDEEDKETEATDKAAMEPKQNEPKKSPAEEEKAGELIGEQPASQAEEVLSEPLLIPRNPLALISRTILIIIFVDVALAMVLLLLAALPGLTSGLMFGVLAVLIILKTLVLVSLIIRASTSWTQHSYYLTERQLVHRRGIANIEEKVYELDNIRHVRLLQDFIGRQFDFGHLELLIATAGLTETIVLNDLKNPEHFKNVFSNYLG